MAQQHLTTFGASESRWVRALALACGAAWCIASVGCGHDEPRVLGPGLDPPKARLDGGAGGEFGNGANGGSGSGGQSVGQDDGQNVDDGTGGNGEASSDAAIPPSCPSGDAGVPSGDAGVPSGDAGVLSGTFNTGSGCDEDAGVSR